MDAKHSTESDKTEDISYVHRMTPLVSFPVTVLKRLLIRESDCSGLVKVNILSVISHYLLPSPPEAPQEEDKPAAEEEANEEQGRRY